MVEMDELLDLVVNEGCSDLHLEVGVAPVIRLHGEMTQLDLPVLTPEDTEALVKWIASPRHLQQLADDGGSDFGFAFGDRARARSCARSPTT